MAKLLAMDTSAAACSVALLVEGDIAERHELAPRDHTRMILPMVDGLLAEAGLGLAQLDGIAFGVGPGAFTGLRICAGVVQGLAFGADLPVLPVSSLAAVAQACFRETPAAAEGLALVCMDARMGELYFGAYTCSGGESRATGAERLLSPADLDLGEVPTEGRRCYALGSGWQFRADMPLPPGLEFAAVDVEVLPRARYVAELGLGRWQRGETLAPASVEPVYLREQVAWQKVPR